MQDFHPSSNGQAVGEGDGVTGSMNNWTVDYTTVQDNFPGNGLELGTNGVAEHDCLTHNGQDDVQVFSEYDVSALTTGPANVTIADNEVSWSDMCNWDGTAATYWQPWTTAQSSLPAWAKTACAGISPTLGITAGAHFWNVYGSYFEGNYVHDNGSRASWWDTDNDGITDTGNYYSNNWAESTLIEISYNALVAGNNYVDNEWWFGACGTTCDIGGNLAPAVYISGSGGDPSVADPQGYGTIAITANNFTDNWAGVSVYENSDRECATNNPAGNAGYCTLLPNAAAFDPNAASGAPVGTAAYYPNFTDTGSGCGQVNLTGTALGSAYYDNCRWKTQNVSVTANTFNFDAATINAGLSALGGTPCTGGSSSAPCGENGLYTTAGSSPSWSPYNGGHTADQVANQAAFGATCTGSNTFSGCTSRGNSFADNTYTHTGAYNWTFMYLDQGSGNVASSTWQSDGLDSGSTFS